MASLFFCQNVTFECKYRFKVDNQRSKQHVGPKRDLIRPLGLMSVDSAEQEGKSLSFSPLPVLMSFFLMLFVHGESPTIFGWLEG